MITELLLSTLLVSQPPVDAYEVEITTPCYKSQDFFNFAGKYRELIENTLTSESNMVIKDMVLVSDTQKTMYVVRENRALGKVCVLSYFDQNKKRERYY